MTGRKYLFVNMSPLMKNEVKPSNDNTMSAEGISDVMVMKKNGKRSVISDVLCIPDMKSNSLSICQLIEKNYKVLIEDKTTRLLV